MSLNLFATNSGPATRPVKALKLDLLAQFPLLEQVLASAGVAVWPMVEFEADDALASGAAAAVRDPRVKQVIICSPDKDLAQCVRGSKIVQLNRRTNVTLDEAGVVKKFGVSPESIPDYLALVGDAADGYPGLPRWGAKSSAAVLSKFGHLESIPADHRNWLVNVTGASTLADTLVRERDRAMLFRNLATLRNHLTLFQDVDELRWSGPYCRFRKACSAPGRGEDGSPEINSPALAEATCQVVKSRCVGRRLQSGEGTCPCRV